MSAVRGRIPVEQVLAAAARSPLGPPAHIPWINMMEARPDLIRVVGLAFEEYVIRAEA